MINIFKFVKTLNPGIFYDINLDDIKNNWNADFCTFDEFNSYVKSNWKLFHKNSKRYGQVTFSRFFAMHYLLFSQRPIYDSSARKPTCFNRGMNCTF